MRIPKVPQDVPVENDNRQAITNITAGRNICMEADLASTTPATKSAAPSESVIAFKDHASVRIAIGGTIALKPSSTHDIQPLKFNTLLQR